MNPYGVAVLVLVAVIFAGTATMLLAGAFAIIRHPDEEAADRISGRYIGPTLLGFGLAVGGLAGLIVTGVIALADAID